MNLYEKLGVEKDASQEEIKKAYREKSKQHHPDKGGDPDKFREASSAYAVLSIPSKRKRYDNGETGEEIQNDLITRDQKIMQVLAAMWVQAIQSADVKTADLVNILRGSLEAHVSKVKREIDKEKKKMERFEEAIKRIKYSGERNIFLSASNQQIGHCQEKIKEHEEQNDVSTGALEMLDAYSYDFEKEEGFPPMMGSFSDRFNIKFNIGE